MTESPTQSRLLDSTCIHTHKHPRTHMHVRTAEHICKYHTHTESPKTSGGVQANIKAQTIETAAAGAGLSYPEKTGSRKDSALAVPRPVSPRAMLQRGHFHRNKSYKCTILA